MELMDGGSCDALRHLPTTDILSVAHQLLSALQALHVAGILHRDIKRANCLRRLDDSRVKLADHSRLRCRYYLRFMVRDEPGVLGQIANVLGENGISIASVIQHEAPLDGDSSFVPLIVMTHSAFEGATSQAVAAIDELPSVRAGSERLRVSE